MKNLTQQVLDEANHQHAWFHAVKTRPVWAQVARKCQVVSSQEGDKVVEKGDVICRGINGELWPQKAETFQRKYHQTGEVEAEGWRKYLPVPDAAGVMAAKVEHEFEVEALWGKLNGKPGDYLVKRAEDREIKYPEDVWIVDQAIFEGTYERKDRPPNG